MKKITIENLKNVKNLEFEIPGRGVYLLTGQNGAGKTSLLGCLRRIGDSNAFPIHFKTSQISKSLDSFKAASVTYQLGEQSVRYEYSGSRWAPTPRARSNFLSKFGYPSVIYIAADSARIEPRQEDFKLHRLRDAAPEIIEASNRILATEKFSRLKTVNLTRGGGNQAFLLELEEHQRGRHFFSEKNFSLGELCILKLIRSLKDCPNNSLVLIDELELALHPKAQAELLIYLQEISKEKDLTIIFSTHSVNLIKRISRENILFLQREDDATTCIKGCFPTFALGNLAYDEETAPDAVIYVEDDAARYIVERLVKLYIANVFTEQVFPTVKVVPIGPFISVIRFINRSRALFPATTRQVAILDQDVKEESLHNYELQRKFPVLQEFEDARDYLTYLPWTPEVGLCNFLSQDIRAKERTLRVHFSDQRITIRQQEFADIPAQAGGEQRRSAKSKLNTISAALSDQLMNVSPEDVGKELFFIFAEDYFRTNRPQIMALLGPIIGQPVRGQRAA